MSAQRLLAWVNVVIGLCVPPIGLIPVGAAWANAIGAPLDDDVRWSLFFTWLMFVAVFLLLMSAYGALEKDAKKERRGPPVVA
jgi:TRAP-type C4-dicarboxylate transport system permease large subunit